MIQTSVVLLSIYGELIVYLRFFFCTGWRLLKLYDKSARTVGKIGVIGVV